MITDYQRHFVYESFSVRQVLEKLNSLAPYPIVFLVSGDNKLLGSITDGDIRRGLIKGLELTTPIIEYVQGKPYSLKQEELTPANFNMLSAKRIKVIPIIDKEGCIVTIINLEKYRSFLPLTAILLAGGEGVRLRPLTLDTPKPLLKVGEKPIIEHNIDRLIRFGISDVTLAIRYLGHQIESYFGDGTSKGISIEYIKEDDPLGTVGALTLKEDYKHEGVLLMNSDLLTNIDYADMYNEFVNQDADIIVATYPYEVKVPFGIIESRENIILSLKEKPTYTYYSNAGIYIIKKNVLELLQKNTFCNATDLIEIAIQRNMHVVNYPILCYWMDIGRPEEFEKAQNDIKHIQI